MQQLEQHPVVYLVTGDIGGTNSRMSLYAVNAHQCQTVHKATGVAVPTIARTYRNSEQYVPESVLEQEDAFVQYIMKPFLSYCWNVEEQQQYIDRMVKEQQEKKRKKQQEQEKDKKDDSADEEAKDEDDEISQTPVRLPPIRENGPTKIVCCIASAGVVSNNQVRLTNLKGLLICGTQIERDTSNAYMKSIVRCVIINDFVAQGYGCLTLQPHEVQHLYGPTIDFSSPNNNGGGPKVCVGAGTGLGECYLTQSQHDETHRDPYSCFPSEGGHVEYAPRNELEVELFQYLSRKYASHHRISVERVVSGKGLANVYEFLAQKFPKSITKSVHEQFLQAGDDQGRVVSEYSKKQPGNSSNKEACKLCQQAMSIMMSAYGCEVGSAAIKWIPTGGLFVSGGLTPKNMEYIAGGLDTDFMTSYRNKGRVSHILDRVPLHAVLVEDLGVRGAHKAALVAYQDYCHEQKQKQQRLSKQKQNEDEEDTYWIMSTTSMKTMTTNRLVIAAVVAAAASMCLTLALFPPASRTSSSTTSRSSSS
ncbi:hypothetical protein ACA910_022705 [Epithemia clementina (nom. ined.)]